MDSWKIQSTGSNFLYMGIWRKYIGEHTTILLIWCSITFWCFIHSITIYLVGIYLAAFHALWLTHCAQPYVFDNFSLRATYLIINYILKVVPLMYKVTTENRFKFTSLSVFGGQHIYKDRDYEDAEYNHVCSNYIDMTMRSFLIKTSLMFPSLAASQIGPLFAYISEGLKTTTLCFRIPFTEAGSDAEFIVNLILQFNLCFFGGLGYLGLEVWMSLVENTVLVSPAIFKLKMKRLCEQYKSKSITEFEMRSTFKNLAIQSTDADEWVFVHCNARSCIDHLKNIFNLIDCSYTAEVSDMLYSRTLLTPILFTYVIGMSIFCQFSVNSFWFFLVLQFSSLS